MKTRIIVITFLSMAIWSCTEPTESLPEKTEYCWTTVGSAGTVDEDPNGVVNIGRTALPIFIPADQPYPANAIDQLVPFDGVVSINHRAVTAHHSIRYNIGQFVETNFVPDILKMKVRYLVKDKTSDRVLVMLKRYPIASPLVNTEPGDVVSLFDSFNHAESPNFQSQEVKVNLSNDPNTGFFDHSAYAYYIDVLLIKYQQNPGPGIPLPIQISPPALSAIQICGWIKTVD